ncbi:dienelactone hydrolase family protein [Desulfocurvus sp. DL9XJH121]
MSAPQPLAYAHQGVELEGLVLRPEGQGPWPGALLIHEYTGLGDYLLPHAEALTREGYLVLCHDMYGRGVRARDRAEASILSRPFRQDRLLMRGRALAGLDALRALPGVDARRCVALGFSFGGGAVLELARSGADVKAVASFYGYPDTTHPANPGDVRARVLVLHGALDRVASMDQLAQLEGEMDVAGADCRVVVYPRAGHAFSNLSARPDPASGSFPCAETHADAWAETLAFFKASGA